MNIEFLGVTYIVGKAVDWIFQTQEMAETKSKNSLVLHFHSCTYATFTIIPVAYIVNISLLPSIIAWSLLWITHAIIDNRTLVKEIMHTIKGLKYEEMDTKYGWLQIGVDQRLHELVILMLALVI